MYLTYKNLLIRNATKDDAEQLSIWWNDGKIMAHAGFPNGTGQTVQDISDSLQNDTDDTHRRLIIEIDNLAVGEMNYRNKGDGVAEIGIKICDFSKQNQGNGKILLSMLIHSLYKDFGFKKIILDTNLKNKRAQHIYEQLGFTQLRVNKDAWIDQVGERQSSVDYALYPADFRNFAT
ncbi:GNAT family N-acetyltransferase [Acutalibacter caecimuris]|uniref:GNAT family N-acetyltransferase n=1 Tax=Acutalibacter caecimuris TaxID=3093657 RepID=UPI002AC8CAC5|nr:GNAT family protein [Acutalibacter sp. M00118]